MISAVLAMMFALDGFAIPIRLYPQSVLREIALRGDNGTRTAVLMEAGQVKPSNSVMLGFSIVAKVLRIRDNTADHSFYRIASYVRPYAYRLPRHDNSADLVINCLCPVKANAKHKISEYSTSRIYIHKIINKECGPSSNVKGGLFPNVRQIYSNNRVSSSKERELPIRKNIDDNPRAMLQVRAFARNFVCLASLGKCLSSLLNGSQQRPKSSYAYGDRHKGEQRRSHSRPSSTLLGGQILFGACCFLAGCYGIVHTIKNASRFSFRAAFFRGNLGYLGMTVGAGLAAFGLFSI